MEDVPRSFLRSRAPKRDTQPIVRVLAVYDGDTARSRRLIKRVLDEVASALGPERFAAAVQVRQLDVAQEPSRRAQRALCRGAELIVAFDAEHLGGFEPPPLARHRVFTLEELTLTLECVAGAPGAHAIVSILEHGHIAFSRSVIAAARAGRSLVPARVRARKRAETVEEYPARLARAIGELAIGRALAS